MPERLDRYVARRLLELRDKHTQDVWKERTGIPQSTTSRWESDESWKTLKNLDERLRLAGFDPFEVLAIGAQRTAESVQDPDVAEIGRILEEAKPERRKRLIRLIKAALLVAELDEKEER